MLINLTQLYEKYKLNINGIIHIGACKCEELEDYNKCGIDNDKIIWIEANQDLVDENIQKNNKIKIDCFICCDTDEGVSQLNITNNLQSSSILDLGLHKIHHPNIIYTDKKMVKNKRMDTYYNENNIPLNFANFLNIDIQGAELLALKGMGDILYNFDYVYTEVNKNYIYKNCAIIEEIDNYLSNYNFKRVETCWTNYEWGDAFYIKQKS